MIYRIISFSIKNKLIVGIATIAIIAFGLYSMRTINLGSVPDITNNQVQVMTVSPNLSTEDIEQLITYPVELEMGNLPGVKEIRSISRFGLSVVTIIFKEEMGTYKPRQLVQEKLNVVRQKIPSSFGNPEMGPISTGLGEIYQYTLQTKPGYDSLYTTTELRSIQDWLVARQMTLIDGVVGVNSFGGAVKQYEVAIDPNQLRSMNISIGEVFRALEDNNVNTGGAYIERNKMANFIRGEGLIHSLDDIRSIVVKNIKGSPITIEDVANKVHYGTQIRYGAFTQNGKEAVGGMVLMLKDSNPNKVVNKVKKRVKKIQKSLPKGIEITPFLDRSDLISRTTDTVTTNLLEGALIVIFALVILLGSIRGGIITATTIPLSLLIAFILMKEFGVWANLMSLGAIDFGIIIDGAIIIIEGTVYEIQKRIRKGGFNSTQKEMDLLTTKASSSMMESAFFGQIIILIVFAPILFLTGIEGKMFKPMAFTFGFAMIGAIILCLTYVPMMASLFMKPKRNKKNWFTRIENGLERFSKKIIKQIHRIYLPVLTVVLRFKLIVIGFAVALIGLTYFTFSRMGGEFIPQLDEGDLAIQALIRPGSSLEEMITTSKKIETILLEEFPEIKTAGSRIGVADIPTDPMPMDIADMFVILEKDHSKWVSASSKKELIQKIKEKLNSTLTGVNLVFSQPVELRFNELLTGVREDVAIKLYGPELEVLSEKAEQLTTLIKNIDGVGDVNAERTAGLPQMTVRYDRDKIAQYGMSIKKINTYLSTAFAGGVAGTIYEGERRFDLVVRLSDENRTSIEDVKHLFIDLPNGSQVMLKELADIQYQPGPMQISREDTRRQTYVGVNTRGKDVQTVVQDIQEKVKQDLNLPPGYTITYGGEFENLKSATNRLMVVVPVALILIFILLYFALKSVRQSIMIYIAIPLAAIGGVYALWLRDMPFSISAGVGFIVLFGVAVLNGLVLINRFNSLKKEGVMDIKKRIKIGTKERIRPILLTATTDILGFLPMAFSTSAGAEVQQPLATTVIGGMISATILTLLVLPVLYYYLENKKRNRSYIGKTTLAGGALILCLGIGGVTRAQQPQQKQALEALPAIGLEKAQQQSMNRIPMLRAKQLQVKQQEVLKKSVWSLGNTVLYTGKSEVGHGNKGVYTRIGLNQQNIDVFGIGPNIKLQKQRIALAENTLDLSKLDIKKEVKKAWAKVYVSKKKYKINQQLDSIFSRIKKAAKVRESVEDVSTLSYLSTVNQANEVAINKTQAYHDYIQAIQQLNLWLVSDTVYTTKATKVNSLLDTQQNLQDSIQSHPLLDLYQQKKKVANAQTRSERSKGFPSFNIGLGEQKVGLQTGFYTFQVGVNIPLVFNRQLGRSQAAKIGQKVASAQYEQQKIQMQAGYQQTVSKYLKWKESWVYYQDEALPLAQRQQKGALTAFQEGDIDYVAFLQTFRDAIKIEMKAWDALEKYLIQKIELDYYIQNN